MQNLFQAAKSLITPGHMYIEYCKERSGCEFYGSGAGFVLFKAQPEFGRVWLEDIYVRPEARLSGESRKLVDAVEAAGKALGYKEIGAAIDSSAINATDSLKAALASGFEVSGSDTHLIYLKKPINGEQNNG